MRTHPTPHLTLTKITGKSDLALLQERAFQLLEATPPCARAKSFVACLKCILQVLSLFVRVCCVWGGEREGGCGGGVQYIYQIPSLHNLSNSKFP